MIKMLESKTHATTNMYMNSETFAHWIAEKQNEKIMCVFILSFSLVISLSGFYLSLYDGKPIKMAK